MLKIETKFETVNGWLIGEAERAPFCQSFEWEEILSREGTEIERLTAVDGNRALAMALVQYYRLPLGWKYAFCPRGPVFEKNVKDEIKNEAVQLITGYLKSKKCIFFRIEPAKDAGIFPGAVRTIDVNPRSTLILDLRKAPEEILKNMHQKTRYNINLSQKKNLQVTDKKDADLFVRMMRDTARRDGFRPHEDRHYHEIIFSPLSYQLTVLDGGRPVACAVFAGFGDTFTYVFGASDYMSRALMAPYLIQWEGIKMAQRFGYRFYDFFGVAPEISSQKSEPADQKDLYAYDPKHRYAGVTRFKGGFGGKYFEDPGTFDLIISPRKYKLYGWLRAVRRIL